jgi:hypothetical protein
LAIVGNMTELHNVNQVWFGDWLPLAMMNLFLFGAVICWLIWDNWRFYKRKRKS